MTSSFRNVKRVHERKKSKLGRRSSQPQIFKFLYWREKCQNVFDKSVHPPTYRFIILLFHPFVHSISHPSLLVSPLFPRLALLPVVLISPRSFLSSSILFFAILFLPCEKCVRMCVCVSVSLRVRVRTLRVCVRYRT